MTIEGSQPVINTVNDSHLLFEDPSSGFFGKGVKEGRSLQEKISAIAQQKIALNSAVSAADQAAYEGAVKEGYQQLKGRMTQFEIKIPLHELFQAAVSQATRASVAMAPEMQTQIAHDLLSHHVKERSAEVVKDLTDRWQEGDLSNEELIGSLEKAIAEMQGWYRSGDPARSEYVRLECFYRPLHEKISPAIKEKTVAEIQYTLHSAQQRVSQAKAEYSPEKKKELEAELARLVDAETAAYNALYEAYVKADNGTSAGAYAASLFGRSFLVESARQKGDVLAEVVAGYEEKKRVVDAKKQQLTEFNLKQESVQKRVDEQQWKDTRFARLAPTDEGRYTAMAKIRLRQDQKRQAELLAIVTPELRPGIGRRVINGALELALEKYKASVAPDDREVIDQVVPVVGAAWNKVSGLYQRALELPRDWANVKKRVGEYRDGAVASYRCAKDWTCDQATRVNTGAQTAGIVLGSLVVANYVGVPVAKVVLGTVLPHVVAGTVYGVSGVCGLASNYLVPALGFGISMSWKAALAPAEFSLGQVADLARYLPVVGSTVGDILQTNYVTGTVAALILGTVCLNVPHSWISSPCSWGLRYTVSAVRSVVNMSCQGAVDVAQLTLRKVADFALDLPVIGSIFSAIVG